ncbi:MAG TPA: hypothetical protein VLU92_11675 [Candidatus Dormibacteraeota bacterium]|nr:hypothetical protein [Candidatus Dormibacteraeota bacterium]
MAHREPRSRRLVETIAAFAVLAAVVLATGAAGVWFATSHLTTRNAARVASPTPTPSYSPLTSPSESPIEASPSISSSPSPPPITGPYVLLSSPSPTVVWALVDNQLLFRSVDQGVSWQQVQSPPGLDANRYSGISFVNDRVGYVLVPVDDCTKSAAELFRTQDAGATWNLVALPPLRCVEYMTFVDVSHGFLSGVEGDYRAVVSRTSDGGQTWLQSTMPDPPGWANSRASLGIEPIKAFGNIVLAAGVFNATIYYFRSSDSGASWIYLPIAHDAKAGFPDFLTPTHWLELNTAEETTDGGHGWHSFDTDYTSVVGLGASAIFPTPDVGYCANYGRIHFTVDGGVHWTVIKTSWP